LTTQLHLVARLRKSGAVPLLPIYVFVTWTGTALLSLEELTVNIKVALRLCLFFLIFDTVCACILRCKGKYFTPVSLLFIYSFTLLLNDAVSIIDNLTWNDLMTGGL
jgi:hypothetical protein